jgi:hypothetical protein
VAALLVMMAGATALWAQISIGGPLSVDRPDAGNPAAARMNAAIQQELRMAGDYMVGKGVPKDLVQSAYWFRKAADQGDAGAQNELGTCTPGASAWSGMMRRLSSGSRGRRGAACSRRS